MKNYTDLDVQTFSYDDLPKLLNNLSSSENQFDVIELSRKQHRARQKLLKYNERLQSIFESSPLLNQNVTANSNPQVQQELQQEIQNLQVLEDKISKLHNEIETMDEIQKQQKELAQKEIMILKPISKVNILINKLFNRNKGHRAPMDQQQRQKLIYRAKQQGLIRNKGDGKTMNSYYDQSQQRQNVYSGKMDQMLALSKEKISSKSFNHQQQDNSDQLKSGRFLIRKNVQHLSHSGGESHRKDNKINQAQEANSSSQKHSPEINQLIVTASQSSNSFLEDESPPKLSDMKFSGKISEKSYQTNIVRQRQDPLAKLKRQSFAQNKIQSGPVQLIKNPYSANHGSLLSANILPIKASQIEQMSNFNISNQNINKGKISRTNFNHSNAMGGITPYKSQVHTPQDKKTAKQFFQTPVVLQNQGYYQQNTQNSIGSKLDQLRTMKTVFSVESQPNNENSTPLNGGGIRSGMNVNITTEHLSNKPGDMTSINNLNQQQVSDKTLELLDLLHQQSSVGHNQSQGKIGQQTKEIHSGLIKPSSNYFNQYLSRHQQTMINSVIPESKENLEQSTTNSQILQLDSAKKRNVLQQQHSSLSGQLPPRSDDKLQRLERVKKLMEFAQRQANEHQNNLEVINENASSESGGKNQQLINPLQISSRQTTKVKTQGILSSVKNVQILSPQSFQGKKNSAGLIKLQKMEPEESDHNQNQSNSRRSNQSKSGAQRNNGFPNQTSVSIQDQKNPSNQLQVNNTIMSSKKPSHNHQLSLSRIQNQNNYQTLQLSSRMMPSSIGNIPISDSSMNLTHTISNTNPGRSTQNRNHQQSMSSKVNNTNSQNTNRTKLQEQKALNVDTRLAQNITKNELSSLRLY
ncbi:UNKNOWN [Stylonychia lemnae]|uniref:Uncharacterized protein n=1 Tax=Stylonychia lemnae TaxID=5949 RepID=A0A078AG02_STYLE|nr:UNKNOWN [Stylonychia lemnae]|eukprot:CDW80377.1 UNKNOWN [Stylonychia lemnae]